MGFNYLGCAYSPLRTVKKFLKASDALLQFPEVHSVLLNEVDCPKGHKGHGLTRVLRHHRCVHHLTVSMPSYDCQNTVANLHLNVLKLAFTTDV